MPATVLIKSSIDGSGLTQILIKLYNPLPQAHLVLNFALNWHHNLAMKVIEAIERRREITRFRPDPLSEECKRVVALLGIGYPSAQPPPKQLHPKKVALYFDTYNGGRR